MPSRNANRLIWAAVLLLIAVLAVQTRGNLDAFYMGVGTLEARIVPSEDTVHLRWRGKIDAPMESRIAEAFELHKDAARKFVLILSSPGGSLDHGARVVRLLRKIGATHGFETVVESGRRCASMCVPVYLQGQRRRAAEDAQFMFHEVSFRDSFSKDDLDVPEAAKGTATDQLFAKYFAPAGVPESWIRGVRADMAGGNDIWKTARELIDENAGIVQETGQ